MSSVDHINAILLLLPDFQNDSDIIYTLANAFFDAAKTMRESEFKYYSNDYVAGMQRLAKQVLNLCVTEIQQNRYKVTALLLRLGQAEEVSAMLGKLKLGKIDYKVYNFVHLPTAKKSLDSKAVLYQVMFAFRLAFPSRPDAIRDIMARRS